MKMLKFTATSWIVLKLLLKVLFFQVIWDALTVSKFISTANIRQIKSSKITHWTSSFHSTEKNQYFYVYQRLPVPLHTFTLLKLCAMPQKRERVKYVCVWPTRHMWFHDCIVNVSIHSELPSLLDNENFLFFRGGKFLRFAANKFPSCWCFFFRTMN